MKISLVTSAALASLLSGAIAHKPSPSKVVHLHVPTSQHAASHPTPADAVSAAESGPARHTAYTPKKGSFFHMKFSGFDHRLQKRATSYITSDGFVTTDQTRATVFFLDKGRLRSNGNVISANPTDPYIYFAANTTVGSITTTWTASNGIAWTNASFTYGAGVAQYCQGLTDQRVYIILQSSPPDCNPVVASPAPTPAPTAAPVTSGTTLASSTAAASSVASASSSAVGSNAASSATSLAAVSSSALSSVMSGMTSQPTFASSSARGSSIASTSIAPASSAAAASSTGAASSTAPGSSTAGQSSTSALSSTVVASSTLAIASSSSASASATPLIASLCADGVGPYFYSVGTDNYGVSCKNYIRSTPPTTQTLNVSSLDECTTSCSQFRTKGLLACIATTFNYITGACSLQTAPTGNGTTSTTNPYFSTFLIYQSGNATATPNCPDDTGKTFYGNANDLYSVRCYADYALNMDFSNGVYGNPSACAFQCSTFRKQGQTCASTEYIYSNGYCYFKTTATFANFPDTNHLAYVYLGPANSLPSSTSTIPTIASSTAASSTIAASSTASIAPLCTNGTSSSAGPYFYNVGGDSYIVSCQAHFNTQTSQITLQNAADLRTCTQACSAYRLNGSYTCLGTNFNSQTSACVLLNTLDGNITSSQSDPQQTTLLITQPGNTSNPTCPADAGKTFAGDSGDVYSVRCGTDFSGNGDYAQFSGTSLPACASSCTSMRNGTLPGQNCLAVRYDASSSTCYFRSQANYLSGGATLQEMVYLGRNGPTPTASSAVATTSATASATPTKALCTQPISYFYTTAGGDRYMVSCTTYTAPSSGTNTLTTSPGYTFEQCNDICSRYRTTGGFYCTAVNFLSDSGSCQLFQVPSGNFTADAGTPRQAAFLIYQPVNTTNPSCPQDTGKTYQGANKDLYSIRCYQDYTGSTDFATSSPANGSMVECGRQCTNYRLSGVAGQNCILTDYQARFAKCYFKVTADFSSSNPFVQELVYLGAAP